MTKMLFTYKNDFEIFRIGVMEKLNITNIEIKINNISYE